MPRTRKGEENDDPFWDSWDKEDFAKENRVPRRTKKKKKVLAAAPDDPFGQDGFGDDWDYKPAMRPFARRDSDHWPLELDTVDSSIDTDWGQGPRRWQTEEAKRKKEREEWSSCRIRKRREAEAKAKAKTQAQAKVKAKQEAAAKSAAEAKAAAEEEWQREVKQATNCVARADPAKALTILYSLSIDDENLLEWIDGEKKKEVSQLYAALYNHYNLQKWLTSTLSENCFNRPTCSEINESLSDEGDRGEVEFDADNNKITMVDRLPTHPQNSKTDECSNESSTVGGGTVKIIRSPIDWESSSEGTISGDTVKRSSSN